jgi:hypothetical protein
VADPVCASCHNIIDPPGLAFEHYDAIGAYRTIDGSSPVDASGELLGNDAALTGEFRDAIELIPRLAASETVQNCVANQWFRFSLGRMESDDDDCSTSFIQAEFRRSGGDVRVLLGAVARSEAFRHVRATAGE